MAFRLLKGTYLIVCISGLASAYYGSTIAALPLYLKDMGEEALFSGLVIGSFFVGELIGRLLLVRKIQPNNQHATLYFSAVVLTVSAFVFAIQWFSFIMIPLRLAQGASFALVSTLSLSAITDMSTSDAERNANIGILTSVNAAMMLVFPIAGLLLYSWLSLTGLYCFCGVMGFLLVWFSRQFISPFRSNLEKTTPVDSRAQTKDTIGALGILLGGGLALGFLEAAFPRLLGGIDLVRLVMIYAVFGISVVVGRILLVTASVSGAFRIGSLAWTLTFVGACLMFAIPAGYLFSLASALFLGLGLGLMTALGYSLAAKTSGSNKIQHLANSQLFLDFGFIAGASLSGLILVGGVKSSAIYMVCLVICVAFAVVKVRKEPTDPN